MTDIYKKIKINLPAILFFLIILVIGFGSIGGGVYNNYNISCSFLYFFIFMLVYYRGEIVRNINKKLFCSVFIMFLSFFISCVFSVYENFESKWMRYYSLVSCVLFGYFSYVLILDGKVGFKQVLQILSIIGIMHVSVLLFIWFSVSNPENYNWINGLYFFSNIRHLSDFLSICFLSSYFLFFIEDKVIVKFLFLFFSVVILSCILWSGSRAAYIGIVFSIFIFLYYQREKIKNLILIVGVFLISLFASTFFQTNNAALGLFHSINRSVGGGVEQFSSSRIWLYKIVLEQFSYHPIWGSGAEVMIGMEIYLNGLNIFQAHNSILQILVEFGVFGLFCVIYVFYVFKEKLNKMRCGFVNFFSFVIVVNIVVASFFNGGGYYVVTLSLMCLFMAFMYHGEIK